MADKDKYLYSAFISYRHADPDQSIAKRIQHSIETFRIPDEYQDSPGERHFSKVFRDSDELSMDRDLASGIDYALSHSEFLIVILSPQYKESQWCLHEIEEFLTTHDRKNILCVLAEGEPRDVLPDIITHVPSDKETGKVVITEPLCADYRLDRTTAERLELPRILSSMLHCTYDDLIKRQEVYRRKRFFQISAAVLAVVAAVIIMQLHNLYKLNNAFQETLYSQSQTLAAESLQHLEDFDREGALDLALAALPDGIAWSGPVTAESLHAISKCTYVYQPMAFAQIRSRYMQNEITGFRITPELHRIITMDKSAWILVQSDKGEQIAYWQVDGSDNYYYGFTLLDEKTVLAWRGGNVYSYDYEGYKRNWGVSVFDDPKDAGILSVELVGDSACCVMTQEKLSLLDLRDGHLLKELSYRDIEKVCSIDAADGSSPGSGSKSSFACFDFQSIFVDESGEIIFSGKIETDFTRDANYQKLCIAAWDPETGALRNKIYELPPYCLKLCSPAPGSLIAVSAYQKYDLAAAGRFSGDSNRNQFSGLEILCFDSETLDFRWEYDTEVTQSVNLPDISFIPSDEESPEPIVSVTFEVDNYMFDLNTGELYFSTTLPDRIIMIETITKNELLFYCSNHKSYSILPWMKNVNESEGLSPFPESVQTAVRSGDQIVAISGEYIYWFGYLTDPGYLGSFSLIALYNNLEFEDAGTDLMAVHSYDTMYIVDLTSHRIIGEIPLIKAEDEDHIEWRFIGSLPDDTGVLLMSRNRENGQVRLYSYESRTNEFSELRTFSESAQFSLDSDWITSIVYNNGIVYMVSSEKKNTLLYYNTVTGDGGDIPVTGIPDSMVLAESYNDYVHERSITQPGLTISPDGLRMFSALYDTSSNKVSGAVIDLETGKSTVLDSLSEYDTRSRSAAFSRDGSMMACSTDYSILIYTNDYSEHSEISISGLNVRSMIWFRNDLWVEFSSNLVRRYNSDGSLQSEICLDYSSSPSFRESPEWTVLPFSDNEEVLMLVDRGNMNLLSADYAAMTPILHIPYFIEWNNNSDTFLVLSPEIKDPDEETGLPIFDLFDYPRRTTEELTQIGNRQFNEMTVNNFN